MKSTGKTLGKCPHCGGSVVEMTYEKNEIACEPPSPKCTSCNREVSVGELK